MASVHILVGSDLSLSLSLALLTCSCPLSPELATYCLTVMLELVSIQVKSASLTIIKFTSFLTFTLAGFLTLSVSRFPYASVGMLYHTWSQSGGCVPIGVMPALCQQCVA